MSPSLTLVDISADDPLFAPAYTVLIELRPHLTKEAFAALFAAEKYANWTSTVALLDGAVVGVANWRLVRNTAHGFSAFIDDLCTTAQMRSHGVGKALSEHVIGRARALGCHDVTLTSGNQRADAHRFYLREGYENTSKFFRYAL